MSAGYLEALAWARDLRGLNTGEKAVLFALASRYPQIRPSIETIAGDAGLSDARCVRRILRSLEAKGLISISMGGGRNIASHYQLHLGNPDRDAGVNGGNPDSNAGVYPLNPDRDAGVYAPETRTKTQQNPDLNAAKGVRLGPPKIQEKKKKKIQERGGVALRARPSPAHSPGGGPDGPPRQQTRKGLPIDWEPSEEGRAWAAKHGMTTDLADQVTLFKAYYADQTFNGHAEHKWTLWCRTYKPSQSQQRKGVGYLLNSSMFDTETTSSPFLLLGREDEP